jgi:hypothetical protein
VQPSPVTLIVQKNGKPNIIKVAGSK